MRTNHLAAGSTGCLDPEKFKGFWQNRQRIFPDFASFGTGVCPWQFGQRMFNESSGCNHTMADRLSPTTVDLAARPNY
jgi:hypothetical protein